MKRSTAYLALIVLGSCLLKCCVLALMIHASAGFTEPDSASYLAPAYYLLQGHSLWSDASLWMRTPGYPLFLAAIFRVFGAHLIAVLIVQIVLSSVLIINAYRIVGLLANTRIALWAAALVAIDYLLVVFSLRILSDLLFASVVSFIFYHFIVFMKNQEKRFYSALMVGILLAVATLIRPISYYLGPLLIMALLIYCYRRVSAKRIIAWALLLIIPSVLLVGTWQIRNKAVIGTYQYTGIDAINFYQYYAADIVAHQKGITFDAAQQQLENQANTHHLTGLVRNDYYRHEGLKILFTHPMLSARQVSVGFFHLLVGVDSAMLYFNTQEWQHHNELHAKLHHAKFRAFFQAAIGMDYIKYLLIGFFYGVNVFLVGASFYFIIAAFSSSTNRSSIILCILVVGYFLLLSSNVCSYGRFKLPFELILDCFAVLGVFSLPYFNKR